MTQLVVMGVAGCGKSVLSQRLAQQLGCAGAEGDDFHLPASQEKMRTGVPLEDADREPWLAAIGRMMAATPGGMVVSCSALKRRYRDLLRTHVPGLLFVYLEIDVHTAAQRVGGRSGHLFPTSLVASQFAALESPDGEPGVLSVSALLPTQAQVEAVTDWLAARDASAAATRSLA